MTHPHGLTRQDVAHLKAGDEVTVRMMIDDEVRTLTSTAYDYADTLWIAGYVLHHHDGAPGAFLVEVISPKPPTPPMAEPTWLGAVVMTDAGPAVRALNPAGDFKDALWMDHDACWWDWTELTNPRPLTPAERRDLGIPATVPDGWVCVDARSIPDEHVSLWAKWNPGESLLAPLATLCRAELARREATA